MKSYRSCVPKTTCPTASRPSATGAASRSRGASTFRWWGSCLRFSVHWRQAGIPVFVTLTFDTDYLFVKQGRLEQALEVLRKAGHEIDS